jgi:hypothetical protein
MNFSAWVRLAVATLALRLVATAQPAALQFSPLPDCYLSPTALVPSGDGKTLLKSVIPRLQRLRHGVREEAFDI